MKVKLLKIGLPMVLCAGTIATVAITLSSCTKNVSFDKISPIQTRSRDYQELFPNLTIEEFKNSFNSKSGIDSILIALNYSPESYQYVNKTLKINGSNVIFWISTLGLKNNKIYEISLFNFYNKGNDPTTKFEIKPNNIIPSNIKDNQYRDIENFEFNNFEKINVSNLKTISNQGILIDKKNALISPLIIQKMNSYKTDILSNFSNDIDGAMKLKLLKSFNDAGILMASSNLFYNKDISFNSETNKIEGNVYIQINNNSKKDINFNIFNKQYTIPALQYLTIGLEFNSDIEANIFKLSSNNFLGLDVNNVNIKSEIANSNLESEVGIINIERSNYLNSQVDGVFIENDFFNQQTFFSQEIEKLENQFFINSLRDNANKEFNQLKNAIVNGIAILEKFNNINVTLEEVLKGIGDNVAKMLEMMKLDNNIINIVKNLLNPQSTSDFLYNTFPNIISILDQNGANVIGSPFYFIKDFLIENLGSKSQKEFEYFISNLKNLKETIKKFVMSIQGLEPSSVSSILSLVDNISKNDNIISFLSDNINVISNLMKSLIPQGTVETKIIISIFNSIGKIEVNNQKGNILKDKFWNLVTNTNTNTKAILGDLLVTISDILPTSQKPEENLIKEALVWIKNFLDSTSIINNFKPENLVEVLDTLLNPIKNGETTKQYFENNFIIEILDQQNLNFDKNNYILNGEFQYVYKFTKELKWDMRRFKEVFYDDGLKLFSLYANWWFEQSKATTNSDKSFVFAINTISKIAGTALAPNRSSIESMPDNFLIPWDARMLRRVLLAFIDINAANLPEDQLTIKNKENFNLLFQINMTNIPNWILSIIEALLPVKLPIVDLAQLSMTINNQNNINKTYERYWKVIFGDNQTSANPSYYIPANSSFTTTNIYRNSQVYPNVEIDGTITWRAPFNWTRDLQGMNGVFSQSALSRVLFSFVNQSKKINAINNDVISNEITKTKLNNYSNNVANPNYKLVLNTKNIELTNKLFNKLKTSYKNSQITQDIQDVLNEVFDVKLPSSLKLFKPTYFILPDDEANPTKYNIQLIFPTNIIIVDKENENLTNKTIEFNNFYAFDLVLITQ